MSGAGPAEGIGMRPKAILLLLLALAPLPASSGLAFVATDLTADRPVLCRPVRAGDRIVLAFTHSMYGGDVREAYVAMGDGRLRRVAVTTANAAAAEYYADTAGVTREGDRFRLEVPDVSFARIVVRADRIGDHRLAVGAETVNLAASTGNTRQVQLALKERPIWNRLLGRAC